MSVVWLKKKNTWKQVNEAEIWRELNTSGFSITQNNVCNLLRSDFVPHYNPLHDYFFQFKNKKWIDEINDINGEEDYIDQIANYVILENPVEHKDFKMHLKKWMIRSIRTIFENGYPNKHAIILVSPEEGIGKSFFCRFMCPEELQTYYTSNPTFKNDKDSQTTLVNKFIINLDELQQFKSEGSKLKSWLSQTEINIRLPYDRKDTLKYRIASFLGTTNEENFLREDLGYSRWICFRIKGTNPINSETKILLKQAWALAYYYFLQNPDLGNLTWEDHAILKENAEEFKMQPAEFEIIEKYLEPSSKDNGGEFMTTTDIMQYLYLYVGHSIKINKIMLGKALKKYGFERCCPKKIYGYWIKKI